MNILEKEIEDLLFEGLNERTELLEERGLPVYYEHFLRQPHLGSYGRPDIVGFTIEPKTNGVRHIGVCIIELKRDDINANTLFQICRYQAGIKHYLTGLNLKNCHFGFSLILIGRTIDYTNDFLFVLDSLKNTSLYTYSLSLLDGLTFSQVKDYYQIDATIPEANHTRYELRDMIRTREESISFIGELLW